MQPAQSYAELLDPIPNAVEILHADGQEAATHSQADDLRVMAQYEFIRHHHHPLSSSPPSPPLIIITIITIIITTTIITIIIISIITIRAGTR